MKASERDPLEMFERIMAEIEAEWDRPAPLPVNSEWHHFVVPGVIYFPQKGGNRNDG